MPVVEAALTLRSLCLPEVVCAVCLFFRSAIMLKGTLKLDASTKPAQMDMVHADGTESLVVLKRQKQ
jgi:hypothetical protein